MSTLEQAAAAVGKLASKVESGEIGAKAAARVGVRAAELGEQRVKRTRLGTHLWAQPSSGLRLSAPVVRSKGVQLEPGVAIATVEAAGMAGLIEAGGRTAPHPIEAKAAKTLAFQGRAGWVFPRAVEHKGGVVHAEPFLEQAAVAATAEVGPQIEQDVTVAVREAGLV